MTRLFINIQNELFPSGCHVKVRTDGVSQEARCQPLVRSWTVCSVILIALSGTRMIPEVLEPPEREHGHLRAVAFPEFSCTVHVRGHGGSTHSGMPVFSPVSLFSCPEIICRTTAFETTEATTQQMGDLTHCTTGRTKGGGWR